MARQAITFSWRGIDKQGQWQTGVMLASNSQEVELKLRRRGITPRKIRKHQTSAGKVKPVDIASFTRQLSTLLSAGVAIMPSFEIIILSSAKPSVKKLLTRIRDEINTGSSLTESFRQQPQHFNSIYCHLVAAGEISGQLDTMLHRLATYLEKATKLKSQVKTALLYPSIVIGAAIIAVGLILSCVIPVFQELFTSFGAKLPFMTQIVFDTSSLMQNYGLYILCVPVIVLLSAKKIWQTNNQLRYKGDAMLLKSPILGNLLTKAIQARWARTAATLFAAGISLVDSLAMIAGATGNLVYQQATEQIQLAVAKGASLSASMAELNLFSPLLLQMVSIGEQSGRLDAMLNKVASIYEDEVDNLLAGLQSMFEPLVIIFVGAIIGFIVVAMYLPIIEMGTAIG